MNGGNYMGKFEYSKEDLLYYKKLVEFSEEDIQNLQPIDMTNIPKIDDIKRQLNEVKTNLDNILFT